MRRYLLIAIVLAACSQPGTDDAPPDETPAVPLEHSAMIVAAEGGEVTLEDGAVLTIPPAALAEDAEVSLRRTCPQVFQLDGFRGCVYLARIGVALQDRVRVELPGHGAEADCVLSQTTDGWRCLGDSEPSDNGSATATFSHVAALTTRSERPDPPADDTCTDLGFEPCGGDVVGEWEMIKACGSRDQITNVSSTKPNPYESCGAGSYYVAYPYSVQATLTFTEDVAVEEFEGEPTNIAPGLAYSRSGSATIWEHELVTESCLASVGESCHSLCESNGVVCECLIRDSSGNTGGGGSYTLVDGELFFDGGETPSPFCVQGDTLTIEHQHHAGPYQAVYRRKQSE